MNSLPQADLFAEQFYIEALRYPLTNELRKTELINQTKSLFSLEKIPFPSILGTELSLVSIVKIRNSNEGIRFRKWLHDHIDSAEDVAGAYVELVKRELPFIYRLVNIVAQPLLSIGIQAITPISGFIADTALSYVNEFKISSFAERFLNPNPPKFFMEIIRSELKKKGV